MSRPISYPLFFFFNDTATSEIYTLSLHDALPISTGFRCTAAELLSGQPASELVRPGHSVCAWCKTASEVVGSEIYDRSVCGRVPVERRKRDRKSTRLNSSHVSISYAVFCLKKKNK